MLDNYAFNGFFDNIGGFINRIIDERTFVIIILCLSVILFFMRIFKKKNEPRQGITYIISNTLFLTTCALEILYVISANDAIWFCTPNSVGWLWTIINFLLFAGMIFNQIMYLFDVFEDVFANGNAGCNLKLGIYSWLGAFIGIIICSIFYERGIIWVFVALCVMQLIQSFLIFRSYGKNIKGAFWGVFVYLFCSIATIVTLMIFIFLLIVVVIGIAVIWLILKFSGFGSSSRGGNARISWSDGHSEEAEETGRGILGERYYRGKDTGRTFQN